MKKVDRSVVRNQAYTKSSIGIRERHNERKNINYRNDDIILERTSLNVYFKKCNDTYLNQFNKLVEDKVISTRGLKEDAKIVDELVFDVNTEYFERCGGYEFAKNFYKEVYNMAVKEVGSEQYILSAVMHADERNSSLSEELGRDVYHYHLHVVYIPVVQKEVKWSKRCKDKSLVGTSKEIINQVSNSKKWTSQQIVDENGKSSLIPSYSLLQDRFFEHMQSAGYAGFERGERGSTTKHLDVLEYKIQQDKQKLLQINKTIEENNNKLALIDCQLKVGNDTVQQLQRIDNIGKKGMFNKINLTEDEYKKLQNFAREGIDSRRKLNELNSEISRLKNNVYQLNKKLDELLDKAKDFFKAIKIAPNKVFDFLNEVIRADKERKQQNKSNRNNRYDYER